MVAVKDNLRLVCHCINSFKGRMRLSDYVADFLSTITSHVFGVCGGGAMYLNDAIAHHPKLKWIATHHEQAAAFAAEAYARVSNKIGVVHVTAGPGVTNAMTGVACAWADSLPMMVIAGQVDSSTLMTHTRQLGISEVNGEVLMRPICKYSVCVRSPEMIRFHLERAFYVATQGRMGPVFLEIPLNVQNADIEPRNLNGYNPIDVIPHRIFEKEVDQCIEMVKAAKRPVIVLGNGVRLSGVAEGAHRLLNLGIPMLSSWSGSDIIDSTHENYIGRPGLIGDRAGNFVVQNADLVLAIGTRLSIPQIGHNWRGFAPNAQLIMVDTDMAEIRKKTLNVKLGIVADAGDFIELFLNKYPRSPLFAAASDWLEKCRSWKRTYPAINQSFAYVNDGIHSYYFLKCLAERIRKDAIIVCDVGTAFVGTMQAMPMSGKQRMFHSPGIAPMGYGLPAAIGAHYASGGKQVICLTGDGGTMFNLQELQTIVTHNLPIVIFLYANCGYKTMQVTQGNHFGREAVASPGDEISWPDFRKIAKAFGILTFTYSDNRSIRDALPDVLGLNVPVLCELNLSISQTIAPLVKTKVEDGKFIPVPLEDMWPYMPRDEFEKNMSN